MKSKNNCINLKKQFGKLYRVTFDEAYDAKGKHDKDVWYMQLPCRLGTIYPYGGDLLAVEIDYHPIIANRFLALGLKLIQDGTDEKTFIFPLARFEEVAAIMQPKRKPQLTDEQRAALRERAKKILKF